MGLTAASVAFLTAMHALAHATALLAQDDSGSSGGGVIQLFILLLIPLAMYMLLIRPQRRRMKTQQEMQSSIGVGDEVITTAGIYGFITGVEDDRFWLEIDDDVQIRVAKAAVQSKITPSSNDDDTADAGNNADES